MGGDVCCDNVRFDCLFFTLTYLNGFNAEFQKRCYTAKEVKQDTRLMVLQTESSPTVVQYMTTTEDCGSYVLLLPQNKVFQCLECCNAKTILAQIQDWL